jgi:LemA protein
MGLWIGLAVAALVIIVIVVVVVASYNGLIRARNAYKAAFAQIDVQLTRRHDLIPNLVETAKGYMAHERQTLEAVINARGAAVQAQSATGGTADDATAVGNLAGAENVLTQALGRLFALAEAYPNLKANENMLALQEELTTTENRIAFARQAYNDSVMGYNNQRQVFPRNILAGALNFDQAPLFELTDPTERQAPQVSF